ncbi:MAG TPA: hypothetical protein VN181_04290, partial [Thermoanaerobaculia bacterium]|nr:hypothetical protein [Thermoanaerobaculia bacterium]
DTEVHAIALDREGQVRGKEFLVAKNAGGAAVAASGERFVIAFAAGNGVFTRMADANGVRGEIIHVDASDVTPLAPFIKVAATHDSFVVAWNDRSPAASLHARAYDRNGNALGEQQTLVAAGASEMGLAARDDGYVVTYTTADANIAAIDLDARGTKLGEPFIVAEDPTPEGFGSVASTGRKTLAAWRNISSTDPVTFRLRSRLDARFLTIGSAGDPLLLSRASPWQEDVKAAPLGNAGFLLAYIEMSAAGQSRALMTARISADGKPLDGAGRGIAAGEKEPFAHAISSAPAPLVVWLEQGRDFAPAQIRAARVQRDGIVHSNVIPLGNAQRNSSVAVVWSGFVDLVVWTTPDRRLVAARVTPEGFVLDAPPLEIAPAAANNPSIAFDGVNYLIAWNDSTLEPCPFLCGPTTHTSIVLLSQNGFFRSTPVRINVQQSAPPRVVWNGSEYTVWQATPLNLWVTRVHSTGVPLETRAVLPGASPYSAAAWNRDEYLFADGVSLTHINRELQVTSTKPFVDSPAQFGDIVIGARPFVVYARKL